MLDDKHVYGSLGFYGLFYWDGFYNHFNGDLHVDSTFYIGKEKHIAITFIQNRSDSIAYETYVSSTNMQDGQISEDKHIGKKELKFVNTSLYNRIQRFVVNLEGFALVSPV